MTSELHERQRLATVLGMRFHGETLRTPPGVFITFPMPLPSLAALQKTCEGAMVGEWVDHNGHGEQGNVCVPPRPRYEWERPGN